MKQKRMLYWILGVCSLVLQATSSFAQELITVKGTVTDKASKATLAGVSITSDDDKTRSTMADNNGGFEIKVPAKSRLNISMTGYQTIKVQAKAGILNIEMDAATTNLDDVVVVGYGTQKKELLSGSVVSMKMDDTRRVSPTTSLGNLLAGQLTGVRVGTPDGVPGTQPGITIRTASSWNAQNVLYVIDGKISGAGDFNNLSPNDIDNISVLKDAASAAVYGARAAGGVIVVTTRRGSKGGRPQINYSFNTGVDKPTKNADLTSAIEMGQIYSRLNPTNAWTQADYDYFKNINNGWGYDQLDAIWQDPYLTTHNLSVSGGSDKVKYFIGGSYAKQGAFMQNLTYKKYNFRTNITADITKDLTLFAGFTINNNVSNGPTNTAVGDVRGIYRKTQLWQPYQPVWTDNGNIIDYGWIGNVGAEVRGDGGYTRSNGLKPVMNLQATYKIRPVKGLSATAGYIPSFTNNRSKTYIKQYTMWVMKQTTPWQISTKDADLVSYKPSSTSNRGKPYIEENHNWSNDYQLNFQLNYDRTFKDHHVQAALIYEKFEAQGGGLTAGRETFPVYVTDQWWAASSNRADDYTSGATETKTGRKSWIGQAFYDYQGKYLATFAYRYDGSMNFPEDKRWGFFPSGSLGWIVSKENFFKARDIQMLKLRASAGMTGNDAVGGFQWQQSYVGGNSIYLGTNPVNNVGITYGPLTNPNLTWEKTLNYNVGVDAGFLKHFTASAEYYFVKTYDILGQRIATVPPTFSRSLPSSNYGQVNAQGVEASIGYNNRKGDFHYYANVNASYGAAKYVTIDENITYPYQKNKDNSTTRIATYETVGMWRTQAEVDAFKAANPNYKFNGIAPAVGQLIYKDLSGKDGKPDGTIDSWDITTVDNNNNSTVLGLNLGVSWKGFSIDASFNGALGQKRFVNNLVDGNVEWNRMWKNWATDAWTPETPNATLPRRYSANDGTRSVTNTASTYWLEKSDFVRLKLLNVGYSIPERLTNKIGIQGIKFYFSGSNLFVISSFNKNYFDPELSDPFGYPIMKNFNLGVNVSL